MLGVRNESGELLVGNGDGVVKIRDFKRIADPGQRWNKELLKEIRGSPFKPNPDVEDEEVHVNVSVPRIPGPVTSPLNIPESEPQIRR